MLTLMLYLATAAGCFYLLSIVLRKAKIEKKSKLENSLSIIVLTVVIVGFFIIFDVSLSDFLNVGDTFEDARRR